MLSGLRFSAFSIVNFSGTSLVGLCEIQEAYSEPLPQRLHSIFLSFILRPSPNAAIFITLIVKVPVIQISTIALAAIILCIELPLPPIKKLSLYRSLVVRIVLLIFQAFLTILFYQVRYLTTLLYFLTYMHLISLRGLTQRFGR